MGSFIRLLPPIKEARHATQYAELLSAVLSQRLLNAARLVLLGTTLVAFVVAPLFGFVRTAVALAFAGISALMLAKTCFKTEQHVYVSAAREILARLLSPALQWSILLLLPSSLVFFRLCLKPSVAPNATTVHTFKPQDYDGVPETMSLHATFDWLAVNETYVYGFSYAIGIALAASLRVVFSGWFTASASIESGGLHGWRRVVYRARNAISTACQSLVVPLIWPAAYSLMVRKHLNVFAPQLSAQLQKFQTVQLRDFHIFQCYVTIPAYYFILVLVWCGAAEVFTTFVTVNPVSCWKFLTDRTSDKTGSLITGLAADPDSIVALAAWNELLVIAEHSESRRKLIYGDTDNGSAWNKIDSLFRKLIDVSPKTVGKTKVEYLHHEHRHHTGKLERVRPEQASFFRAGSALEKKLARFSSALQTSNASKAKHARETILGWLRNIHRLAGELNEQFLSTRLGSLFRRTVKRTLQRELRHQQTTSFALRAMARLVSHSLAEDEFGYVQDTVAGELASMDALATRLEAMVIHPPINATDVLVRRGEDKPDVSPALTLLAETNAAFEEIAVVFKPYFANLGVGKKSVDRANKKLVVAENAFLTHPHTTEVKPETK